MSFGDLNGDGAPELLVGWSQYNTRNQKLALYFLNDTLEEQAVDEIYTHMLVNEFTGSGRDDLMLFSATGADAPTSVKLLSYEDGRLVSRGTAELDAGIQRFGTSKTVALSETVNGVFIDCYKDPNTTITELLFGTREPTRDGEAGDAVLSRRGQADDPDGQGNPPSP